MKDSPLLKKSDEIAYTVYKITKQFPKEELYGMTSQLRRAALSIPLNLVEGFARNSQKEHRKFLRISYGSLKETKYLLHFAHREKYLPTEDYKKIIGLCEEVGKMLWASLETVNNNLKSS